MNSAHIHLLLNHVAILAAIFSVFILAFGVLRKNTSIIHIALAGFVVSALAVIPVFNTGEGAEEAVEHLPGVLESLIEEHEEAAEASLWFIELAGALSLAALIMRSKQLFRSTAFYVFMLAISVGASVSIAYTGYLGGKIRHTEITAASGVADPGAGAGQDGKEEDDD